MSGKPDPYADIDFEEINEQTNLANALQYPRTSAEEYFRLTNHSIFPGPGAKPA